MYAVAFLLISMVISTLAVPHQTILWDGRPSVGSQATDFDDPNVSLYNVGWNKGQNQSWSDIISFPKVAGSINDKSKKHKPFEVSINDESIFVVPGNEQRGFRRSELMPITNNGTDLTVQGTTTIHLSLKADVSKPLNYSHLYDLVFVETSTYDAHVWSIKTGLAYDNSSPPQKKHFLRLYGYKDWSRPDGMDLLFETPFDMHSWHNFAVTTTWGSLSGQGSIEARYSKGYHENLRRVVRQTPNNADRGGQYHIGVFKHPTGETEDVVHKGYQPQGINEGVIYGGIFIEKGRR